MGSITIKIARSTHKTQKGLRTVFTMAAMLPHASLHRWPQLMKETKMGSLGFKVVGQYFIPVNKSEGHVGYMQAHAADLAVCGEKASYFPHARPIQILIKSYIQPLFLFKFWLALYSAILLLGCYFILLYFLLFYFFLFVF
jgi:hypothetical protein